MKYIDYFRRDQQEPPSAPFSYRPLVPFVASLLPLDPMSALNVVNLLFLGVGLVFFRVALTDFGYSDQESFVGCFIFIFSFPTFYYSTIGFVDGALMGILLTAMVFVSKNKPISLVALALLGLFVKETAIILLPVALMLAFRQHTNERAGIHSKSRTLLTLWRATLLAGFLLVGCYILLRQIAPGNSQYFWLPSFSTLRSNLANARTAFTFLLTLGVPALLAFLTARRLVVSGEGLSRFVPLIAGASMSLLLFIYSLFSAHSDGRFLWTSYPFLIPIGLSFFRDDKLIRMPKW